MNVVYKSIMINNLGLKNYWIKVSLSLYITGMYKSVQLRCNVKNGSFPAIINEIFNIRENNHHSLRLLSQFIIPHVNRSLMEMKWKGFSVNTF